jgi:hypothetical protein
MKKPLPSAIAATQVAEVDEDDLTYQPSTHPASPISEEDDSVSLTPISIHTSKGTQFRFRCIIMPKFQNKIPFL